MSELFWGLFDIWNVLKEMAWQINIVILLVLLCRIFVGKVSKQASYFLWVIVALRLLVPVMPESGFSVFNATQPELFQANTVITEERTTSESPSQDNVGTILQNPSEHVTNMMEDVDGTYENVGDNAGYTVQQFPSSENITPETSQFLQVDWMFLVWLAGVVFMAAYGVISYVVLKYKLRFATSNDHRVYEDEHISSPFVFGIIKPCVYLPYRLSKEEREYILMHENYHIKRRDYLVKILAFGLLSVYWFQPLVWVAFYLMSRDMELSCDEQVLKELGLDERKAYSALLLSFACEKRIPLPSPVSFGENDIKSRIKSILNYKKPTFWSLVAMLALVAGLVAVCLTDAKDNADSDNEIDESYEITDEATKELAERLYKNRNTGIADTIADGYIFDILFEEMGIDNSQVELQTSVKVPWICLSFSSKPSDYKMWQVSAMFLALVDDAEEVRWSYYDEWGYLCTNYVTVDSVNNNIGGMNMKDYSVSEEKIAELWEVLDLKRVSIIYETNGENTGGLIAVNNWERYALKAGMDFEERLEWEKRLIADGIGYRGDNGLVRNSIYQDFDQNGTKDLIVIIRDTNWEDTIDERFYIYMNDEPVYAHELTYSGAVWNVTVADIDNDGYQEFLFAGDSGGTGGYGFNAIYELLKYKNGTFETMPLPLDEFCEYEDETAGFGVEVYTAEGEGNYTAYCPALDKSISFSIGKTLSEVFEADTPAGTLVGRECYGFHELTPVLQNGRYYLLAEESIYRTNIDYRMEDIGTAYFLLSWDETTGWVVEKFDVLPYGSSDMTDEMHFDRMLRELAFYPMTYADIMATPNLPVVDMNNRIVKDSSGIISLRNFSEIESGQENGYVGNQMVYVKLNEDNTPIYHSIYHNSDGHYFYLEAYAISSENAGESYLPKNAKVFADCIYETLDGNDGTSNTYYYLVEEGITSEDIFDYLISSYYTEPKFVSFLSVGTTSAFEKISQVISEDWNIMPNEVVVDSWWNHSIQNTGNTAFYAYYDEENKQLIYKHLEESYSYDLTEVLSGYEEWNWQTAGIFVNEKDETTYICLSDFNITYEKVQNPQTILIEFPTENPEDYQITAFEQGLAWIDNCYLVGDCIYIQSENSLMAIDIYTKELRFCNEERTLLEAYAKKNFGEEPYHTYFFNAVRAENNTVIYSAAVAEAEDTLPVAGMVFVACKDGKPIGYMCADYANSEAVDGIVIEMIN